MLKVLNSVFPADITKHINDGLAHLMAIPIQESIDMTAKLELDNMEDYYAQSLSSLFPYGFPQVYVVERYCNLYNKIKDEQIIDSIGNVEQYVLFQVVKQYHKQYPIHRIPDNVAEKLALRMVHMKTDFTWLDYQDFLFSAQSVAHYPELLFPDFDFLELA